ncbi:MAG: DUF4329 domain-containing protein [Pseudomonadota bacterium]
MKGALCRLYFVLCLSACVADVPEPDTAFNEAAIAFMNDLQPRSIAENREYCGFLGRDASGEFRATAPVRGDAESCEIVGFPETFEVIASYHTHGGYDFDIDSEVPSSDDITSDVADQTFGYIATPGGRIWLVDWRNRSASQLCEIDCVHSDPDFVPGYADPIPRTVTLRDIRRRERG